MSEARLQSENTTKSLNQANAPFRDSRALKIASKIYEFMLKKYASEVYLLKVDLILIRAQYFDLKVFSTQHKSKHVYLLLNEFLQ